MLSYEVLEELIYDYLAEQSLATNFGIKHYLAKQFESKRELLDFYLEHKVWIFRIGEKLAFVLLKKNQHCTSENRKNAFYETVFLEYENMFEHNLEQFTEEFGEVDDWPAAKAKLKQDLEMILPEVVCSNLSISYQYQNSQTTFYLDEIPLSDIV